MKKGLFNKARHMCTAGKRPKVTFQLLTHLISDKFVKNTILILGNVKKKQRPQALFWKGAGAKKIKLRQSHPPHG